MLRGPKRIWPHCGHAHLRHHLPLALPAGNYTLKVAETTRRWQLGRMLTFEDVLQHEVRAAPQDAEAERILLIFDSDHPYVAEAAQETRHKRH